MKEKIRNLFDEMKVRSRYKSMSDIINMIEPIVNQEVEKRIAERMPSDELIEEIQEKSLLEYENAPICEIDYYSGFDDGVKWLRSRLAKTEGGGE